MIGAVCAGRLFRMSAVPRRALCAHWSARRHRRLHTSLCIVNGISNLQSAPCYLKNARHRNQYLLSIIILKITLLLIVLEKVT